MKKHLLLSLAVIFILSLNSALFSQINQDWKWVHPSPQGNTLRHVKAINSTTWIAIGYAGTFLKTTNSGTNWTIYTNAGGTQATGQGRILYSGWFFDANTGLVCGSGGWIGRTTNGGLSWDSITCSSTGTLYGMRFVNSTTGFIGGSSATVQKTTDAGLTWTALTGPTGTIYNIFALDANNIYAPTSSGGILWISTNGGANWTSVSTGATTLYDVNFISTSTGFVCGSSGNVRVTTNGGVNWTNATTGTSTFYELYTSSTTVTPFAENFNGTTFPPTGWRAVNVAGPLTWVRSTAQYHSSPSSAFINYDCSGLSTDWLITPQVPVYAGDSLTFWLRTNDSGFLPDSLAVRVSTTDTALISFTTRVLLLSEGVNYPPSGTWARYAVSMNSFAGQNIYIGFKHTDNCGDGVYLDDVQLGLGGQQATVYAVGDAMNIYKSANLGANWTAMSHLDPTQPWTSTWYSMDITGTTMLAVGASGLFNISTNSGTNWVTKQRWLSAGTMYSVWCEYGTGKVWAVGSPGISGTTFDQILYSSNGGVTFSNQVTTSWATFRSIHMFNGNTGFISGNYGAIRKTTNGGTTWDSVATIIPSTANLYKIDFIDANTGWAFSQTTTGGSVWKTTTGGTVWTAQSFGALEGRIYSGDMVDANTGYVGNYTPKILKTTDGGATWTELTNTPMGSGYIYGVKFLTTSLGFVVGSSGARVARTTNGGTSWDTLAVPYATTYYATDWVDANNGVIVGSSSVTCKTTNGGVSWIMQNTSASTLYGVDMRSADTMYTSGSPAGAVLKWQKNPVGITTWEQNVPVTYYLTQNYPNPFNPSTKFKFGLPVKGNVALNIYDVTGRLVKTLFNNAPLNAGTVTVEFDGTNLASGVYFYTLFVNDNRIDTKKMVLVK